MEEYTSKIDEKSGYIFLASRRPHVRFVNGGVKGRDVSILYLFIYVASNIVTFRMFIANWNFGYPQ
jgi:hypothetical protein